MFEARPYQNECIFKVLDDWDKGAKGHPDGARSVLVTVPTGGGKTHIMGELVSKVTYPELGNKRKGRVLVLVHRDELLQQAMNKISMHLEKGITIGKVNSEKKELEADVLFAMVGSLTGCMDDLRAACEKVGYIKWVLTDEAHHAYAKSWKNIYHKIEDWSEGDWFHVGLTATPMRLNSREALSDVFPKVSFAISIFDLISAGYLVPFRGITVETQTLDHLAEIAPEGEGKDFLDSEMDKALSMDIPFLMTVVSSYFKYANKRKAVAFCAGQGEAEALSRLFNANRIKSGYIHGNMKLSERRKINEMFAKGELHVLCNCMVLTEGWDETSVNAVLLARPTRSLGLYMQMLGRGLRLHQGKDDCVVIDFHGISQIEELSFRKLADVLEFYGMTVAAKMSRRRKPKEDIDSDAGDDEGGLVVSEDGSEPGEIVRGFEERVKNTSEDPLLIGGASETVVDKKSIGDMEEMQESFDNKCVKGVEDFGLAVISGEIEDVASLQEYPWFIHTGIEAVEFLKGYSVVLMPSPLGTKDQIASRLRKLKLVPYVVCHEGEDRWFSKLSSGSMGRAAARMKANLFIRYFGDKEAQSPKNKWRFDDVEPALLKEGYVLSAELSKTFPIPIPFRQRAVNRGVSVDMINTMKCIKVIQDSSMEREMDDVNLMFRKKLLEDMNITDVTKIIDDPCTGMEFDLGDSDSEKESMVRQAVFLVRKCNDPDVISFIEGCEVTNKGDVLLFTRKTKPDYSPLHVAVVNKITLQLSRALNALYPGVLVEVRDSADVVHAFVAEEARKQREIAKEIYKNMLR